MWLFWYYMVPHVPIHSSLGGIAYNSSIVVTSWKTSKPGAFDLNIMELSAYVRKQTYG